MTAIKPLFPRQTVPTLEVPTVDGDVWRLHGQKPENFTLIVFYRGLHCPICTTYIGDLNRRVDEFEQRGAGVFTLSSDTQDRARAAKDKWGLDKLTVGYGLDLDKAREWGLYISSGQGMTSAGVEEPDFFNEPGLFLVRPDGTLYFGTVQTMPFARPQFGEILKALDFVLARDYPARGEVVDHKPKAA